MKSILPLWRAVENCYNKNQGLVIWGENQLTGLYMADTLDVKNFLTTDFCEFRSIRFQTTVLKNTCNKVF